MRFLKSLYIVLVGSQLWVGLAAGCLAILSFSRPFSVAALEYGALLSLGVAAVYGYMRWVQQRQQRSMPQLSQHWWGHSSWLPGAVMGLFGLLLLVLLADGYSLSFYLSLLPAAAVALLYPGLFPPPLRGFTSLRRVPFLKIALIALCWTYVTVVLPHWLEGGQWKGTFWADLGLRFLLVIGLTIPFDVRDLARDEARLRTLPQVIGRQPALSWSMALLVLNQLWAGLAYVMGAQSLSVSLAWMLGLELGIQIIRGLKKERPAPYVSFWVEGIPVWLWLLTGLALATQSYLYL